MQKKDSVILMDENGKRRDGRAPGDLRPIHIEANVLSNASGSCYLEWGGNKLLVAVHGPREAQPRHLQDQTKAIIQCRYNMAAFSVGERKRPGPDRRSTEISKVLSEALDAAVFTQRFPRATIDVYIEVLEASAGTRCAGLTAASVALADAGIPMRDMVAAVAAGKVGDTVVLDLDKEEDNHGTADLPMAILPRTGEIVLLQMDGHLTADELDRAQTMAIEGCLEINRQQVEALKKCYQSDDNGADNAGYADSDGGDADTAGYDDSDDGATDNAGSDDSDGGDADNAGSADVDADNAGSDDSDDDDADNNEHEADEKIDDDPQVTETFGSGGLDPNVSLFDEKEGDE